MICIQCMQVLKYTLPNITKYYHVSKEDTTMFLNIIGICTCFEPSNFSNPCITMHYPGNYTANQIQHVTETTIHLSLQYLFVRGVQQYKIYGLLTTLLFEYAPNSKIYINNRLSFKIPSHHLLLHSLCL